MPASTLTLPRAARPTGRLVVNPRHQARLTELALDRAEAVLDLPGEVVSGHPDRHVMRVELPGWPCGLFLKRQHRVAWRERVDEGPCAGRGVEREDLQG